MSTLISFRGPTSERNGSDVEEQTFSRLFGFFILFFKENNPGWKFLWKVTVEVKNQETEALNLPESNSVFDSNMWGFDSFKERKNRRFF